MSTGLVRQFAGSVQTASGSTETTVVVSCDLIGSLGLSYPCVIGVEFRLVGLATNIENQHSTYLKVTNSVAAYSADAPSFSMYALDALEMIAAPGTPMRYVGHLMGTADLSIASGVLLGRVTPTNTVGVKDWLGVLELTIYKPD